MGIQTIRSKWTIPYLIIFPLIFIGLYWFAFSSSNIGDNQVFQLGIINNDRGLGLQIRELLNNDTVTEEGEWFPHTSEVITNGFGFEVIKFLKDLRYDNSTSSTEIFDVQVFNSTDNLKRALGKRELDIALIFPQNYSNASLSSVNDYWHTEFGYYLHEVIQTSFPNSPDFPTHVNSTIQILGDNNYLNFKIASSILSIFIENYHDLSNYFVTYGGRVGLNLDEVYQVSVLKYTFFEMMVPGLIMFGIIIQPSLFSMFLCIEFKPDKRTFDRIMISPLSPSSYVLGSLLIQIPIMLTQTALLFLASFILGFDPQGNIFLGFLIACSMFPFSASLNYITAAFFSNEDVAGTVTGFGAPILGFMTGAFVEAPNIVILPNIFPMASGYARDLLLWDFIPLTHGINAIREVLLYKFTLDMVLMDLIANLVLSAIFLLFFIYIYIKMRFKTGK
jgi:ABC-type multidrug transport system permease subunit